MILANNYPEMGFPVYPSILQNVNQPMLRPVENSYHLQNKYGSQVPLMNAPPRYNLNPNLNRYSPLNDKNQPQRVNNRPYVKVYINNKLYLLA